MDELRIAEDRVLKMIIEPMHKHQHLLARRRMHQAAEIDDCLRPVIVFGLERHEIGRRIAGKLTGLLDFPDLAHAVGRNRHNNVGEVEPGPAIAGKHFGGRAPRPCRRDQHFDLVDAGRGRRNGFEIASWKGAARNADHQSGAKHALTQCSPPPWAELSHAPPRPRLQQGNDSEQATSRQSENPRRLAGDAVDT